MRLDGCPQGACRTGAASFVRWAAALQGHGLYLPQGQAWHLVASSLLQADKVWAEGFRGQGVKMGVFDTGIKGDHPDVKHIV